MAGAMLLGGLLAGWALLALDGRRPGALGFHLGRRLGVESLAGWGIGSLAALATAGTMWLAGGIEIRGEPGTVVGWVVAGAGALWLFLLPAAAEEVVFRGYPLQALAESWGPGVAVAATSVGFGVVHLANPEVGWIGAVNVALAGAWLGTLLLRTGSLWWATAAHLGWNWGHGFLADLPVSGLDLVDAPGVAASPKGPGWVSGAGFGAEGSVAATAVLLGLTAWTWSSETLRPSAAVREAGPLALLGPEGAGVDPGDRGDRGDEETGRDKGSDG